MAKYRKGRKRGQTMLDAPSKNHRIVREVSKYMKDLGLENLSVAKAAGVSPDVVSRLKLGRYKNPYRVQGVHKIREYLIREMEMRTDPDDYVHEPDPAAEAAPEPQEAPKKKLNIKKLQRAAARKVRAVELSEILGVYLEIQLHINHTGVYGTMMKMANDRFRNLISEINQEGGV